MLERFERIDVLVNNAGMLQDGLVSMMSDEQWHAVIDANLHAVFYLTRNLAMHMARNRGGAIINIASDAGRMGGAGRANYSAAKAGGRRLFQGCSPRVGCVQRARKRRQPRLH